MSLGECICARTVVGDLNGFSNIVFEVDLVSLKSLLADVDKFALIMTAFQSIYVDSLNVTVPSRLR